MLDTAVVLAATIVAILAAVRFQVEGRLLDLLLAAGFCVAGIGTLAFSVAPVLGGEPQGPAEAWAALGSRLLAAVLIVLAPLVPGRRIAAPATRSSSRGSPSLALGLLALWLSLTASRLVVARARSAVRGAGRSTVTVTLVVPRAPRARSPGSASLPATAGTARTSTAGSRSRRR